MSVLTPSEAELRKTRRALLESTRLSEKELRTRAASYQLTAREVDALREIDEIDFLLGR